ncbi:MAG: hypothetical protein M0C28_46635 [Candidatus Moduliflexus flocculans]|nr:hypothetical protein [Candidatus Moduliflexus flocculans]
MTSCGESRGAAPAGAGRPPAVHRPSISSTPASRAWRIVPRAAPAVEA